MGPLTVRLKAEGDALAARGEYEAAAVKYQAAANQEPEDVAIRFALGSALSHLNRREETVQQFKFVVLRGKPDSAEVQAARRWLVAAGEAAEAVTFAPSGSPAPAATPAPRPSAPAPPPAAAGGTLKGKAEGPGGREVNLVLIGTDDSNYDLAFTSRVKPGEGYEFNKVPPGNYRLTVEDPESGAEPRDVPVTVTAGKETIVDLTSANRK